MSIAKPHAPRLAPLHRWLVGLVVATPVWFWAYLHLIDFANAMLALTGLTRQTHLGEALHFLFFDTPKVLLLLTGIVFVMGIVQTFFAPERTRGLLSAGVPLGITFSFLISAPMVNEVALVLLFGMFGWKVAGLYLGMGLLVAIVSGLVIGRLHMEKHLEDWVPAIARGEAVPAEQVRLSWVQRFEAGWGRVREIVGKVVHAGGVPSRDKIAQWLG